MAFGDFADKVLSTPGEWDLTGTATLDTTASRLGGVGEKGLLLTASYSGETPTHGAASNATPVACELGEWAAILLWAKPIDPEGIDDQSELLVQVNGQYVARLRHPHEDDDWAQYAIPFRCRANTLTVRFSLAAESVDEQGWCIDDIALVRAFQSTSVRTFRTTEQVKISGGEDGIPSRLLAPGTEFDVPIRDGAPLPRVLVELLDTPAKVEEI